MKKLTKAETKKVQGGFPWDLVNKIIRTVPKIIDYFV